MKTLDGRFATFFAYAAADTAQGVRRNPSSALRSEDDELPQEKRRKVVARSRDMRRNFEIARWAINKHLDFTSQFSFRSDTGNKPLDAVINRFIEKWSLAENFDATARFNLRRMMRLVEGLRTVDGDLLIVKLSDGKIQLVEGDRIRNPEGLSTLAIDPKTFTQGVQLVKGRAKNYAIHSRNGSSFRFERLVSADNAILHGYLDRYDQIRGVSPMTAALNRLRDIYENYGFAHARAKISQFIGLIRKLSPQNRDELPNPGESPEDGLEHPSEPKTYSVNPDDGPAEIEIEHDEDVKLLESNTPSNEFREFNQVMVSVALKSLDLPYSFYDEAYTNFFGSKAALTLYLRSAETKQQDNRELLDHLTRWRLELAVLDGELDLTPFGVTLDDLYWKWTPKGVPWWDKSREVRGDLQAIHAGFEDYDSIIAARTGETFEDVIDRIADQRAYAASKGVSLEAPRNLFAPDVAPVDSNNGDKSP